MRSEPQAWALVEVLKVIGEKGRAHYADIMALGVEATAVAAAV